MHRWPIVLLTRRGPCRRRVRPMHRTFFGEASLHVTRVVLDWQDTLPHPDVTFAP
jgi:hypothetical protein